jgi:biopolymer transport protein ExbD
LLSFGALALLGAAGCTSALRAEVTALREQVGKLRDDVEALKEVVQSAPPAAQAQHPRQRVTVIGQPGDAVRVIVGEHAVFVNGQLVQEADVPGHLAQVATSNPALRVIVAADRQVRQSRVLALLEAIKQVGIKHVSIAAPAASP